MSVKIEKTPLALAMGLAWSMSAVAAEPADVTLQEVVVKGQKEVAQDGYRATLTRVGKVAQDPHDVPQAITTVTNNIMEEQQASSLKEALRNVSGLTFNAAEGGRAGDNMMLRGFYTFGDMYLDGIRDTAQYNRETFNLEQVDVLRGSAAMLFGRGQAGGVINQVSKTPLLADRNKVSASVGTNDYSEFTGDFNKRLGDSTALRVNAMKREDGSWRKNPVTGTEASVGRKGLAFSIGTGLGRTDEFVLSHITTKTNDQLDFGVRFDNNTRAVNTWFPASTFYNTAKNFDKSDTNITTLTHTHRFDGGAEWRTQLRKADYERSYWGKTPAGPTTNPVAAALAPDANSFAGGNQIRGMDYETTTVQTDYNNKVKLAGMEHQFLVGAEYFQEDSFRSRLKNNGGSTAANPPDYRPYGYPAAPENGFNQFKSNSYAIYAQDTVEFIPSWKATLGMRHDVMDAKYNIFNVPANKVLDSNLKYSENSYRSALSWQPAEDKHYYISFSDSFSPTADLYQLTVASLPAERSDVLELGAKWMLFDGDLALRGALYRANKEWERNTDLESTSAILTKKRRTDGLELEAAGRINEHWELFSGLALMDSTVLEVAQNYTGTPPVLSSANAGYQGQRSRNTPTYTFNLWSTYKFADGWKVGGGMEAKGERLGYNPGSPTLPNGATTFSANTAPAFVRWDVMAAYEQKKYAVRVNVQNLFNKVYYNDLYDNGGFAIPGTNRKLIMTGEYKF